VILINDVVTVIRMTEEKCLTDQSNDITPCAASSVLPVSLHDMYVIDVLQ
jgi:hypothetical protein